MPTNGQAVKIAHYSRSKFNSLTNKDSATIYYVKEPDGTIKQYIGSTHVISDITKAKIDTALKGDGAGSTQLGPSAYASGDYSTALGPWTSSEGEKSIAIGQDVSATNEGSIAIGSGTDASGINSIAIGEFAYASGENSIAIGYETEVTEDNVVDFGSARQVRVNETPKSNRDAASKKYVDAKVASGGGGGGGTQLGAVRVNVDLDDMALGSVEDGWKYGIEVSYDGLPTEDVQIWLFRYINKSSTNRSGKRRKNAMRHFFYDSSSEIHNNLTRALGIQWNGATLNYNTDMIIPTIIPTTQMTLKDGMLRATLIAAEHVEAIIESAGIITANDMYLNWKSESLAHLTAILGVAAVKKNPDNPHYPIVGPMTKFSIGFKPLSYGDNYNIRTKFKMM